MPEFKITEKELIRRHTIDRELKVDEKEKGRLAVGVGFIRDFDPENEVIEIIRRKK